MALLLSAALFGVVGLVVGSFLGALTYRWPRGMSVKVGRSVCPHCKHKIAWFDNIPVLSYLLLGGKCRNCHRKISLRYPFIELVTAIGFLGIGYFWPSLYFLLVFSTLIAIFVIDLEHQLIPDQLVFFLLVITYSLLLITSAPDFYVRVAFGFAAALFLMLIHLITQGRGMGLGDVKFALFGGTFFGWPAVLTWLFVSFLTGGAVAFILILLSKAKLKQKIAFGPFLIIGFVFTFIWGEKILKIVLG